MELLTCRFAAAPAMRLITPACGASLRFELLASSVTGSCVGD